MEKMIEAMRLVDLVVAVIALITRMRDMNTELTKRLTDLRRKRPRSETLARVERQLVLKFATMGIVLVPVLPSEDADAEEKPAKKSRRGRHPGRADLPAHLERVPEVNLVPPGMRVWIDSSGRRRLRGRRSVLRLDTSIANGRGCCSFLPTATSS